jgi:predicted HTH domain antitoxin
MSKSDEVTFELPYGVTKDEALTMLAVKLFENGRISLGQAAKLAGFSKQAFIEVLGKQQIPVINYSPDELREELGL